MKKLLGLIAGFGLVASAPASAYDWMVVGKVIGVEVTYAPGNLPFKVDVAGGSCPAGTFLLWSPKGSDSFLKAQN